MTSVRQIKSAVFLIFNLSLAGLYLFHVAPAEAHSIDCARLAKKLSFSRLEAAASRSTHSPSVRAPHWFKSALPEGMSFIARPGREHAPNRIQKEFGDGFVALRAHLEFEGNYYTTNVGVNPEALAENFYRMQRGEKKSLLRDNARAAGLFTHGGGTNLSTWGNGNNAAAQLGKRYIDIISLDFFGHGENQPKSYSDRPRDYVEFGAWFMNEYMNTGVPLFPIGHSMGGQVSDIFHLRMSPTEIEKKFPGLPIKAVIMLSPPTDPTYGANLHTKVTRDNEFTDRSAQEALFDRDNINLRSQEPLTDLAFLASWNDELLQQATYPALSIMGNKDDVCFLGCEEAYHRGIVLRPNTTSILYNQVVDHTGEPTKADHMIPKYYLPEQAELSGVGKNMPIAYLDTLTFIEREVIGNKEFDPRSSESENLLTSHQLNEAQQVEAYLKWNHKVSRAEALEVVQERNAKRAYKGSLSRIFGLFAKNLVFREFIKNYHFKKKVLVSPNLGEDINVFISALDRFTNDFTRFVRYQSNNKIPIESPEDWATFQNWVINESASEKSNAIKLLERWSKSDTMTHQFGANLLARSLGLQTTSSSIRDLGPSFPVRFETVLNKMKQKKTIEEISRDITLEKEVILGFRDLDLKTLASIHPELKALSDEKAKIFAEHRELTNLRNKVQLPTLIKLYAQQTQMQKLFAKDDIYALAKKGAQIDQMIIKMENESLAHPATNFEEAKAKYDALLADGWKEESFESFLGPEMRVLFSSLHARDTEISKLPNDNANSKKLMSAQKAFLDQWNSGLHEMNATTALIRGASDFAESTSAELIQGRNQVERIRNEALDLLEQFFNVRESFIRDNHHLWTEDSRPSYPAKYYELIVAYEAKQLEFQSAKLEYDQIQQKIARSGDFGPYVNFLYSKFSELDESIAKVNGRDEDTVSSDPQSISLTASESRMQEIEMRLEEIEEYVISNYATNLYRTETTNAWAVFDNASEAPTPEQLNKILDAWNRVWRDPTGGQVQESSAY
jgi:hypothetical protein